MKTWIRGSLLAVAGLACSANAASAGGFGIYIGTYPSYPVYAAPQAYAAPQTVYSAPQVMMYQPAAATFSAPAYPAAPVYPQTPTFAQPGYPAAGGIDRYRSRVRYRPLYGDFVQRYRGRATW